MELNYTLNNYAELITDENGEEFEASNYRISEYAYPNIVISRDIIDENMRKERINSYTQSYTIYLDQVDMDKIRVNKIYNKNGADIIVGKYELIIPCNNKNGFEFKSNTKNQHSKKTENITLNFTDNIMAQLFVLKLKNLTNLTTNQLGENKNLDY
ncbi:MAG: hypothetical protein GY756_21755 [bacterium]|nr:hypothetical protein [bacterium]